MIAAQTKAKVIASTRVNVSPIKVIATMSVMVGERYCRKPSVTMLMRRTPAA